MIKTLLGTIAIFAFGIVSISNLNGEIQTDDQQPVAQESPQPADVQDPPAPVAPEPAPVPEPAPAIVTPIAPVQGEYVPVPESVLLAPQAIQAEMPCGSCCSQPCCSQPVCCNPCPVPTTFCIVEPCSGCSYEICVDVPTCCVDQQPVVTWRGGIFGRKIAKLCWPCCDKRVKVVVTRRGKVRVRG